MEKPEIKTKISITKVKPNMILAEDVISPGGIVILPQNTMLNALNIAKLKANDIKSINVWSREDIAQEMEEADAAVNELNKPVTDRKEYKVFAQNYDMEIDKTKDSLVSIGNGSEIDVDKLYLLTGDLVENINCKSDIFNYLGYLKTYTEHTYSHSLNVSILCSLFAKWLHMDEEETKNLVVAGLLHDIGKVKVSNDLLNKKGKLTKEEFEEIKKHAFVGYKLVENQDISDDVKSAILMHHERVDGSGYPLGIKEDRITKHAKIVAICDVYDAMTSNRVYRDRFCPFDVIYNFERESLGVLDAEYLLLFLQNIAYSYVGSWVKLSNGEKAEIVFINKSDMSRPIVKNEKAFIDLSKEKSLNIVEII